MKIDEYKILINKKSNKYKNKKTTINNIKFDSQDEANFYQYLLQLNIESIILQPKFTLQPKFIDNKGNKIREINYIADFQICGDVFDVKGMTTKDFLIKLKMFKFNHPNLNIHVGKSKELINIFNQLRREYAT
jgi:hypothetical protein